MQITQNAGQEEMARSIDNLNKENEKILKFDLPMCEFKENVKNVLNLDDSMIEKLADEDMYIKPTKLNYYLIPSMQINIGWKHLFHITRKPVIIHNITANNALDIHNSNKYPGTRSYSFTNDEALLQNIIKELQAGRFIIDKIN